MPPRPSPTHFLCIPLAGAQLAQALSSFRADVTSATSFGLPEEAVRPLGTLHLTLGVMALRSEDLDRAMALLRSLRVGEMLTEARAARSASRPGGPSVPPSPATPTGTFSIAVRGLRSMQPPARAAVLYAAPSDREGILYDFCKRLREPFLDAGLMVQDGRALLLHATVFNTVYVRNRGGGRRREKLTIDARDLLSRYDAYTWAEDLPIARLAICRMGAKPIEGTDDAAYEIEAEVAF